MSEANAGDLMVREDVVDACREGSFRIFAVQTIHEALEVLTGMPAGAQGDDGRYPDSTLLALAVERARDYWRKAAERGDDHDRRKGSDEENTQPTPPAEGPKGFPRE